MAINAEGNLAAGLLAETAHVSDPVLIQPIRERFFAAAAAVETSLRQLPEGPAKAELQQASEALLALGAGADNIFDVRERELKAIAEARTSFQAKRKHMTAALKAAHEALLATLTPIIDNATFELILASEEVTKESAKAITALVEGGINKLQLLLTVRAEGNLAAGLLNAAADMSEASMLQPLRERFIASEGHIRRMLAQLPASLNDGALHEAATGLIDLGNADDGIFALRRKEIGQIAVAQASLEASRTLVLQLGEAVAQLVTTARDESDATASRSAEAIEGGKLFMMIITAASVVGAVIVMLYYVGPQIIRPLESIPTAMSELAAGDTSLDIPGRDRGDELGRMAQALGVFRDTAIEVQKSNLKEIRDTRRRLSDAIESISEAFSLYDPEDRLVICNSKYRTLLYPEIAEEINPGMTFEAIIRRAAEQGYIRDAKGRIEEWLAERLARHQEPGGSHVQQRGDGRWIMVSERKTDDGGIVAVYSDITELKQREAELADKSSSLEQLSNQLAKYLSPQVYESIFTGKQEVTLESRRKKLTVFFSDIAGFTETADRLESEDLTQLLNHYLTEMSQIALDHGATIDKYVGDAIVIFFGDPDTKGVKDDALACVKMAIAMQRRMGELQSVWRESGIENPLVCRIGINTGFCTVGNFGSEDRMDYTIIGGGVNLASRLETAATPGEILISYETFAQVKDQILCEEKDAITVKGIAYPIVSYQVVDSYDNLNRDRHVIREEHANFKLDLDLDAMSGDERSHAASALRRALNQLHGSG
ncbi:MAG: HAMP domain-containing protein [Lysobacterales bacterium]|nr:MAG: HAMP domain-containing protein [Xanthomonadales bacterium]